MTEILSDQSYTDEKAPEAEGESDSEKEQSNSDEKIVEEAKARRKLCEDAEHDTRVLAQEDRRFRAGEQWPAEIKSARELDGRPCLTINKMPQFEQSVTNDQRQNRPAIKVHPVDDKADVETAKILQGVIKHIEVSSNADTARDTAFENAVRGSYGYYRIVTGYTSPESFDQEIRTKRIRDADTVYLDPNSQEPDGSDAEYGFIEERIPKDKYRADYGESALAKASDAEWESYCNSSPDWVKRDTVLVTEYFYKEYTEKHLALLSDGQILEMSEAQDLVEASMDQGVDELGQPVASLQIVKDRKAQVPTVKWCKLNGIEILSKTDWLGRWIPIIPVYGAELVVDGKLIRESLIRHAKDPARMYNFWKSAETEAITLAPKAPFVVTEGQIDGYETEWKQANRRNHAYLTAKGYDAQGRPLPPPQRQGFEPPVQAITQASMLAADEVKSVIGIYDASLGARSNETSGVAIQRRNQQAQTSNFHFTDNLNRSIRHEGRIYVDLIPKIYDSARVARIIGEDGEQKVVKLNQPTGEIGKDGKPLIYNLGVGTYDVTIDTGPSYATRRQEGAAAMLDLSKSIPQIGQAAPDLVVKSLDVPGAQDMAERLRKTLPPGLVDDGKGGPQLPPEVQAQMEQMGQQLEQLQKDRADLLMERQQKLIEIESKERIEMAKLETQATIELAKLESKEALVSLQEQISELDRRQKQIGFDEPFPLNEPEQPEPQEMEQGPAGAQGADGGEQFQDPTGGVPPGSPMEGNFQ